MSKRKPDNLTSVRLELQNSEREMLEMVSASLTARNITASISNLLTPLTQCTPAGAIFAATIFETILFTQNKGVLWGLFGVGKGLGEFTYQAADDVVSRLQTNYEQGRTRQAETINPDHQTEMSERESLRDYQEEAKKEAGFFWNPIRGGWVDPVTGEIVSRDKNDPLYT